MAARALGTRLPSPGPPPGEATRAMGSGAGSGAATGARPAGGATRSWGLPRNVGSCSNPQKMRKVSRNISLLEMSMFDNIYIMCVRVCVYIML
jgi:hypothetical protein